MFRKILAVTSAREHNQFFILLCLYLIAGVVETFSIGAIFSFVQLLSSPDIFIETKVIKFVTNFTGINKIDDFYQPLTILVVVVFILKNLYLVYVYYFQNKLVFLAQAKYSRNLLDIYLQKPYIFHTNNNSATLIRNVNSEVSMFITSLLLPAITIISEIIVITLIVIFLAIINPQTTLLTGFFFGVTAGIFYALIRKRIRTLGYKRQSHGRIMWKKLNEALGGVKETKVHNNETMFVQNYGNEIKTIGWINIWVNLMMILPRHYNEIVLMVTVVSIIIFQMSEPNITFIDMVPIIAMYGTAAFRIMPGANRIITQMARLRFGLSALDVIYEELISSKNEIEKVEKNIKKLPFDREIVLNNVSLSYPDSPVMAVENISMEIHKGERIAFVGQSGSGKSTIVDLILGLLTPTHGNICIDDKKLDHQNVSNWQRKIGYVPQSIYLLDETLKCNIAYQYDIEKIDEERIQSVIKIAQLDEFIDTLPNGINTVVGERGSRLSGGQIQRIGIARALYNDPDILILDEATSSVDNITEEEISLAFENLGIDKTIIIIAHRLNTVKQCDQLYLIENGKIINRGTFEHLVNDSETFKKLALR